VLIPTSEILDLDRHSNHPVWNASWMDNRVSDTIKNQLFTVHAIEMARQTLHALNFLGVRVLVVVPKAECRNPSRIGLAVDASVYASGVMNAQPEVFEVLRIWIVKRGDKALDDWDKLIAPFFRL